MPLRLQFDRVVFTKTFHDWVAMKANPNAPRAQHPLIARPILESLRDELKAHWVVQSPPFPFDYRHGTKVIQVVGRPNLYLFVAHEQGRTGTELRVVGAKFSPEVKGIPPFKQAAAVDSLKDEREAVQVYLRRQIESSQYELEIEALERVALAFRQQLHLVEETDDVEQE